MKEILSYKDLFRELVVKDIKMRHKQTAMGVVWVIFQPLLSMVIFTFIFGVIIKIPSDNLPYPLFVFLGLIFWNFFSTSVTAASGSLVGNESLIKKVYFPRLIVPLTAIATNLLDFLISTVFLVLLCIIYGIAPHPAIILFYPVLTFIVLVMCVGLGFFLSALNVRYRDVRQILPFFIQILIFLTPVFYSTGLISLNRQWILSINPLTTVISITRSLFVGNIQINYINLLISSFSALISLIVGYWYFKKTEKYFADLI
jgi:lipopolysaccharide transport system permease protein